MLATTPNTGIDILFSVLIVLATIGGSVYLIYRVLRDRRKYREEAVTIIDGLLTKSEIQSSITSFLSKATHDIVFSLFLVELDKFHDIVNAFGPKESIKIFEKITQRVIQVLPKKTQLARINKDQYLIFIKGEYSRAEYLDLAKSIQNAINAPLPILHNTTIQVASSIGISFFPAHGEKFKVLMNSLDIAVYIAQREGGNKIIIYSDEMSKTESENVQYYHQIKEAIERKEFVLYYQPIIDVVDNKISGAEGLLRWEHPEHGMLTPQHFINILEQSGDINWVGLWGLETIIKTYFSLKNKFPSLDLKLSLNLSPKQLINEKLAVGFEKVLKRYKMNARSITLEIVEFAMFERYSVIHDNIKQLKELGFEIAIDGLGLDYPTLTKLEYLPIDTIKLDKAFVGDDHESFVKEKFTDLLVDFANKSNRTIISEGVEDEKMIQMVKGHGIRYVQGYYFARPLPEKEFFDYIKTEGWKIKEPEVDVIDEAEEAEINDQDEEMEAEITEELEPKEEIDELSKTENLKENEELAEKEQK